MINFNYKKRSIYSILYVKLNIIYYGTLLYYSIRLMPAGQKL